MNKRTVLITGASRGIGKAIAESFQQLGYQLILPARSELDLSSENSVQDFALKIKTQKQKIDILINNAGINEICEIRDIQCEQLEKLFQVNLFSAVSLTQAVLPQMAEQQWGRIINISSIFGGNLSKEGRAMYTMTKAALSAFTKTCAIEYGNKNILVNSISPGYIETEMTFKNNSQADIDKILKRIPLGRMAKATEIAQYVLFLSSEANTYMTGQNITVDGGFSCK
jgi:3-oxoacyl-[acyl-carrier protein] reductase